MATTVGQGFRELKQNLEITDLQAKAVSTRQQEVRSAMEDGLSVLDSFLTGSYARSTLISPLALADVDIFIVLDSRYHSSGPSKVLEAARNTLRKRYPTTSGIDPNGQAVTIAFSDFKVDAVPAFNRLGGGYIIPDAPTASWISTDPQKHAGFVTEANKAHNGDLISLIKMMKAWNRRTGGLFSGFYIELLTCSLLQSRAIIDFPTSVRYVLSEASGAVVRPMPDPAGFGGPIRPWRNAATTEKVFEVIKKSVIAASGAAAAEAIGQPQLAISFWREIFGDYFPAWG
jgi:hypothetical protein